MEQSKYILFLFIFFTLVQCGSQKNDKSNDPKKVTGIVIDIVGPLPGASIIVKRTKQYIQTDIDGKFEIEAIKGDTLIIGYTGMVTKKVRVKSKNYYKISMRSYGTGGHILRTHYNENNEIITD